MQTPLHCVETRSLTFGYSSTEPVLKSIDLKVEQGSIYGFLGPNGAGKTTTLRLILGLLKIQTGQVSIFGKDLAKGRLEILRQVGSMIESPSLYGHLTAYENLALLCKVYRCSTDAINQALELVDLTQTKNKKVSQFSLGMKQRLGIAVALLHRPPLLILDEPTNGLDPNGIIEMRALLKKLNKESGTTIVISSHLLAEIEKLVSHVGIIHQGKMRFQGTLEKLQLLTRQNNDTVTIETDNMPATKEIVEQLGHRCEVGEGYVLIKNITKANIAVVNASLVASSINVYGISSQTSYLENIFMEIINR
ncbi:MAG TPA: ABC transporter ATP-binding protein [Chryseosolibacter sp.]